MVLIFWPLLIFKNGFWPLLFDHLYFFIKFLRLNLLKKWVLAKKSGFLATFKIGFGHKKVPVYAGLRAFGHFPTFILYFILKK
jgi:hypothetical protein